MTFETQYGTMIDGKLQPGGFKAQDAHPQSEESDVERDGYRTLSQQIKELEDAGVLLKQALQRQYPARPPLPLPDPEPEPQP